MYERPFQPFRFFAVGVRQRNPGTLLLLGLLGSGTVVLSAFVGDVLSHPPPATGPFAYNTFVPPNTPGASYVDPILGSTVRRLTTDGLGDDIYGSNMWWSADGTKYLHNDQVIDTLTGAVTHVGIPRGDHGWDKGFDAADPNGILYFLGATLRKVTLGAAGTKTDTVYFTAPAPLTNVGGSINWLDASGRYMVLRYGAEPSVRVFDRQNLAAGPYANAANGSEVEAGGYFGLTPDGKFLVSGTRSWSINHSTRVVSPSGTISWTLCGQHAALMSASDGRNYAIRGNCYDAPEYWRVDITNNAEGLGAAAQKALPNNQRLLVSPSWTYDSHFSTVAKGVLRDWVFISMEDATDNFNGSVENWLPYRSEIVAVNALTGEVRRLAHHRSRSMTADYVNQPRISTSWGGEFIGWASNFNQSGVVNIFATPFAAGPLAPTNLRILP